jgi:hypothetical protein
MEMSVPEEPIVDEVVDPIATIICDVAESSLQRSRAITPITTVRQGDERKAITQGNDEEGQEAVSPPVKNVRSTAGQEAEREAAPVEADDEEMSPASDIYPLNPDVTFGGVEEEELKEARGVDNMMLSEKLLEDSQPDEEKREAFQQVYMEMGVPKKPIVDEVVDPIETIIGDVAENSGHRSREITPSPPCDRDPNGRESCRRMTMRGRRSRLL